MKGFVTYPTYRIIDNKAYVYLFGRLENGESFLTINFARPYFWIKKSDLKKAQELVSFDHEEPGFKNFSHEEVVKILVNIPKEVPEMRKLFIDNNIATYEADVRFAYRFMFDHGVKGVLDVEGEHKKGNYVDRIYKEPTIKEAKDYEVKLCTLSFDIETNGTASEIFSIALHTTKTDTKKTKEVLIQSKDEVKGAKHFSDEKTMLEAFLKRVQEIDPDFITGWNVIDFDLQVIKKQCEKHKVPFILGRAEWTSSLRIASDFFRSSNADIAGRQVLDGIEMLKGAFIKLDDYKLDTAASEILGKAKTEKFQDKRAEIEAMFKDDKPRLVEYNLQDTVLVTEILEKKDLINLTIQRSKLTGMQPDRVNASIASLDNLYLRETTAKKLVCPTSGFGDREERIKGGYVREGKPGIYDFVMVLDFKSLYPSIIRTFNIDPYSFDKKGQIKAPNGARFRNEEGILPMLIQRLWQMRDHAKKKKDEVASYAIKITMNSFFGVLANPHCRFYSIELGNAITHFGQEIVKETAQIVDDKGYEVIYGDTDSIFVNTATTNFKDTKKIGLEIQQLINTHFKKKVKTEFKRESFLELEFEKVFKKFILPTVRGSTKGAKKRYAGLLVDKDGKEKMSFTGLEFVRRDWTDLAKEFQLTLLNKIFNNQEVQEYIKEFVQEVRDGKHDELLVYTKALRKPLASYVKTTPPHVKAARKLKKLNSKIIRYYLTKNGPEPIENHSSQIDYDHYIEKQLKPIADSILEFFDTTFEELTSKKQQKKLFDF